MRDEIVQALGPCPVPLPGAVYAGARKDGEPLLEREAVWHPEDAFFLLSEARAAEMTRRRLVKRVDVPPNSRFAALAFTVCPAPTAAQAAEAGFEFAAVWWPVAEGSYWGPAPLSGLGLGRSGWDARFRTVEEAATFFAQHPGTPVLFTYPEGEGRVALLWRNGALIQVSTDVRRMK